MTGGIKNETVHIVGGGLVGPLCALFLAKRGFKVALYERRGDIRKGKIEAGRSINLVITSRGLLAMERVGLRQSALDIAIPLEGRMLHDQKGQTSFVPYGHKEGEVINAVSRGLLNKLLLEEAGKHENITLHFHKRCTAYDLKSKTVRLMDEQTGKEENINANVIIGTDGAFSAVRRAMLDSLPNFNYAQDFLPYGYKELVIPGDGSGKHAMHGGALHIWPRGEYMLIGIPNIDGSFTCTLFFPYSGAHSFETLKTAPQVIKFFEDTFPDAVPLMPTLAADFTGNPTGSLVTVRCAPWHAGGQACVIGDAAHAIVPFYGQGMNCGFEDCTALGEILDAGAGSWEETFRRLYERRKPNADAIADMALENFVEMRATTADPKFQLKKQVGFALENRFPQHFIPRYSMVMFHPEIPYAEARRLGILQEKMLEELCANINDPAQIDWERADKLIRALR